MNIPVLTKIPKKVKKERVPIIHIDTINSRVQRNNSNFHKLKSDIAHIQSARLDQESDTSLVISLDSDAHIEDDFRKVTPKFVKRKNQISKMQKVATFIPTTQKSPLMAHLESLKPRATQFETGIIDMIGDMFGSRSNKSNSIMNRVGSVQSILEEDPSITSPMLGNIS